MANLYGFNAHEVDPAVEMEALPAGKYEAVIIQSETKPTKAGSGEYLELTFQIIAGPYQNRLLWARLNLQNANATAVKIARSELSALCRAIGVMTPRDSTDLHNLPVLLQVKCKKRADTGEIQNEIRGYAKREAGGAAQPSQATTTTPPWRRP